MQVTGPIPVTPRSEPYRAFQDGGEDEMLASYGYLRDEYLVSGKTADGPYTTRVLVYRPAAAEQFSGTAVVEVFQNSIWGQARRYLMRSGHLWLGIASRGGNWLRTICNSSPARYQSLQLPDPGLNPEVLAQVVAELRRDGTRELLPGFALRHTILASYSGDSAPVRQYIAATAHARTREQVFDGYFVAGTAVGSKPEPLPDIDRPVLELVNENEVVRSFARGAASLEYRRPDGERYRLYEIPGAGHISTRARRLPSVFDFGACVERCASQFPMNHVYNNALHRLVRWITAGESAPRAERIRMLADGRTIARDEHGNALGGVRTTYLDVPTATYVVVSTNNPASGRFTRCDMMGHELVFPREKIEKLYPTRADYTARVTQRVAELVREGWYLETDAEEITEEAAELAWPPTPPPARAPAAHGERPGAPPAPRRPAK